MATVWRLAFHNWCRNLTLVKPIKMNIFCQNLFWLDVDYLKDVHMKEIILFCYCRQLATCSNVLKKAHRHTLNSQTVINLNHLVCTKVLKSTLTFTIDYMMSIDEYFLLFIWNMIWKINFCFEINRCHKQQNAFFNKRKRFYAAWGMERVIHPAHKRL